MLFSGSYDGSARLWDVAGGKPTVTLQRARPVVAVAISPDGKGLLTRTPSRVQLWAVATGKPLGVPTRCVNNDAGLAFRPNGKTYLASPGRRGRSPSR